jgi:hypothetical protein
MNKEVAWMNDSGGCFLSDGSKYSENWTALYTSPPKREPPMTGREMYQRGYAKAKGDLKREPLSDDWIKDNMHLIHRDVSFTDLVRSIEKAHGIGVNDE